MTALLHALWDQPPRDAPRLQQQAYRYMMQALRRVESRVPGILSAPDEASGAQVMEAACATLLNPKIPAELRTGALTMLQRRMHSVDTATPERLYLPRNLYQNTIAPDFGDQLAALEAFEDALHRFLTLPHAGKPASEGDAPKPSRPPLLQLGVLEALLVTRLGCCSLAALAQVGARASQKPCVYEQWAWIDLGLAGFGGAPQLRRLFLDPVTLAAWLALCPHAESLPAVPPHLKAGKQASLRAKLASNALGALVAAMTDADCASPIRSLRSLCAAETQRLYVTTMPLLATYAKGDIASSSLHPATWARLLGCVPSANAPTPEAGEVSKDAGATPLPSDVHARGGTSPSEAAAQGDFDEDGLIAQLRNVMRAPRAEWPQGFDRLIEELTPDPEIHGTACCIVRWLRYLTVDYRSKGKRLRDGSISYYRGLLANRLLEYLPANLDGIGEDELHDAYAAILQSRTSNGQVRNLRMALGAFDRYARTELYPELPHTQLLTGIEGTYTISNRIVTVAEYRAGLQQIDDGSLVVANETLRRQLRAFWILAFRLGMRRREILGLQIRDLDDPFIWVRKNPGRALKTPNAHRILTLEPIPETERLAVNGVLHGRPEYRVQGRDYVFFGPSIPTTAALDAHPAVALANALLERVTGDGHLHPHNLRHSFATLYFLGSVGKDFGIESHPCTLSFMRDAVGAGASMAGLAAGALHRQAARGAALGMLMGHGSERTTYEHYVHCLDLLLFIACTHPQRTPQRLSSREQLARSRKQVRALLGWAAASRLPGKDLFGTLATIIERHGDGVIELHLDEAHQDGGSAAANTPQNDAFPTLSSLLARADAGQRGFPARQAERDSAEALLVVLRKVPVEQRSMLVALLSRWVAARVKNDDWASMAPAAARSWITGAAELGAQLPLQAAHVTRYASGNKKRFRPVANPLGPRAYRDTRGRYWVRFADTRLRRPRKRDGGAKRRRARTQSAITWLVTELVRVLQESPALT